MLTLEDYWAMFADFLVGHAALALYLFVIMDVRGWRMLKKLPALLLSPLLATLLGTGLYAVFPNHSLVRYCLSSCAILLMCTVWVRWAWRTGFWRAFPTVCMAGVFQVASSCLLYTSPSPRDS